MGENRSNFPKLELYTLILKGAVEEIQFAWLLRWLTLSFLFVPPLRYQPETWYVNNVIHNLENQWKANLDIFFLIFRATVMMMMIISRCGKTKDKATNECIICATQALVHIIAVTPQQSIKHFEY